MLISPCFFLAICILKYGKTNKSMYFVCGSFNQSISQSVSQSVSQTINQSINQSIQVVNETISSKRTSES